MFPLAVFILTVGFQHVSLFIYILAAVLVASGRQFTLSASADQLAVIV